MKREIRTVLVVICAVVLIVAVFFLLRSCDSMKSVVSNDATDTSTTVPLSLSDATDPSVSTTVPPETDPSEQPSVTESSDSNVTEPKPSVPQVTEPVMAQLESITVMSETVRTTYSVGDAFDASGLVLIGQYSDGGQREITSGFTIAPVSFSAVGEYIVAITYQNLSTDLITQFYAAELVSISVRSMPNQVDYFVGEELDTTGLTLTATYSDGTEQVIPSGFSCTPSLLNSAGKHSITIHYNGKETTFDVQVNEVTISRISVRTMPDKTVYTEGDQLDLTGLTLTAYYSDGSEKNVSDGFSVTPSKLSYDSTQPITVHYEGVSTDFDVSVQLVIVASGSCGDALTWEQTKGGTLIISGSGEMYDYSYSNPAGCTAPWNGFSRLVISDGVTSIGKYAFYMQSGLTSVDIANSVRKIGNYAFAQCANLQEITIADGVETLGNDVFRGDYRLSSVKIGKGLRTIGDNAFANCYGLTNVPVDQGNAYYSNDDYGALYTKDKTELIVFPKNVTRKVVLPEGLKIVRSFAFVRCALSDVVIPDSVTTIGFYAFMDCKSLVRVTIGSGVRDILADAFRGCNALEEIRITSIDCSIYDSKNTMGIPDGTALCGYSGSSVQSYAEKYGYYFERIA